MREAGELPPLPVATAARLEARLGDGGRRWAESVPARAARYVRDFGLCPGEPVLEGGTWAYLLPCETADSHPVVLKVSAHVPHARREAQALAHWRASRPAVPAVELVDAREDEGVLLLGRVEPGSHHRPRSPHDLAPLLRSLHAPASPAARGFVAQAEVVAEIVRVAFDRLSVAGAVGRRDLREAQVSAADLLETASRIPTGCCTATCRPGTFSTGPRVRSSSIPPA